LFLKPNRDFPPKQFQKMPAGIGLSKREDFDETFGFEKRWFSRKIKHFSTTLPPCINQIFDLVSFKLLEVLRAHLF